MNKLKTLKDVCEELDVTRRIIQGYESQGLIKCDGKNKYGHLLYGQETIKRIAYIRFLQQIGFSINEIRNIIDLPYIDLKDILSKQMIILKQEINNLEYLLKQISLIIKTIDKDDYLDEIIKIIKDKYI